MSAPSAPPAMRGSRSPAVARTRGAGPGAACAQAPSTERLVSLPYLSHRQLMRRVDIETCGPGQYLYAHGDRQAGALLPLCDDVTLIGRGVAAALSLDDQSVSRRHAILVRRAGEMWIVDERSANGVFVNGQRVLQAKLHDDDELLIGRLRFTYVAR